MHRAVGVVNLIQAAIFVGLASELGPRWGGAAVLFGAAAVAQVAGGIALIAKKGPTVARIAAIVSLVAGAIIVGLHLQVGIHVIHQFTPTGGRQAWQLIGTVLLAVPWVAFFPLWQLIVTRPSRREAQAASTLVALALLLPPVQGMLSGGVSQRYPSQDGRVAATWIREHTLGLTDAPPPDGPGPVVLVASVVANGRVLRSQTVEADRLADALGALHLTVPNEGEAGFHLDVVVEEGRLWAPLLAKEGFAFVRPAESGLRRTDRVVGTLEAWRTAVATSVRIAPELRVPALELSKLSKEEVVGWVRAESWLADENGTFAMERTWTEPPALTREALVAAAIDGARHIAANQHSSGKYAYVVKGPDGSYGGGYNYPRHAGATWFLARARTASSDHRIDAALRRGVGFMARRTVMLPDGRGMVFDPTRKDGKVWVGTTALFLLALIEADLEPDLQVAYTAWIASAVDEQGVLRGDWLREEGRWDGTFEYTYSQGQGMLALAKAAQAGIPGAAEALERAAAYVDGAYMPMPASYFFTLDEHWTCGAAVATWEARGAPAGAALCDAYLENPSTPRITPGSPMHVNTGAGGGIAEAVAARARLDQMAGVQGPWTQRALDFAEVLLASQFRPADTTLLGRPDRLLGGFRPAPWDLDVRVDAVQHIGCSLFDVAELLAHEAG